ncbi:unnamed protein product [Cuscuta epithymum]|uniref:Uncharacterized protein n=1 Tax=Cuscuta epithymum TaxID=186058 RepID=A0AAV0CZS1_9ASTE|nr:unnamed protein product [Cuscuta epithymum]
MSSNLNESVSSTNEKSDSLPPSPASSQGELEASQPSSPSSYEDPSLSAKSDLLVRKWKVLPQKFTRRKAIALGIISDKERDKKYAEMGRVADEDAAKLKEDHLKRGIVKKGSLELLGIFQKTNPKKEKWLMK